MSSNTNPLRKSGSTITRKPLFRLLELLVPFNILCHASLVNASIMRVGVSSIDITPPTGAPQYSGPAEGADTPLHAKAIVFQQGQESGALLICDFSRIDRRLSQIVRSRASQATGIPFQFISIASTHTHSGLRYSMQTYLSAGDPSAPDVRDSHEGQLVEKMVEALVTAHQQKQDVELIGGIGQAEHLTQNRRHLLKTGHVRWHRVRPEDTVHPAGPIDPNVHFVFFRPSGQEAFTASLTVFACHPTTQIRNRNFHADYPYFLHQRLEEAFGPDMISVFGNGTCGDLEARQGIPGAGTITEKVGYGIADAVKKALPDANALKPDLKVVSRTIMLPVQDYTEAEYQWALDQNAPPLYPESDFLTQRRRMKILRLARLREEGEVSPPVVSGDPWWLPVEIQIFRLDAQTAIVTTPGHSFAELGLDLKEKSPFPNTLLIDFAHTNIGYTVPKKVFAQGGYQPLNSRLVPGGVETLFSEILTMLNTLVP